jgi:hypothetical protein
MYGGAGAGKTRAIKSLAADGHMTLVLSAEAGLLSLKKKEEGDDESWRKRVKVKQIKTIDDLADAFSTLEGGDHPYTWVVLDSFSEIAEVCFSAAMAANKDKRAAYSDFGDQIMNVARGFRNLPIGVYMTAKEEAKTDKATGRVTFHPSTPWDKISAQLPFLFDECFRLVIIENPETKEPDRWILTQLDGKSVGVKDRSGALDPYESPDLGAIVRKIQGTTTQEKKGSAA